MIQEQLDTRSENRAEYFSSSIRPYIEELRSKMDLVQHTINEGLIDGLERLLKCKFLSLLACNIIQYNIRGSG